VTATIKVEVTLTVPDGCESLVEAIRWVDGLPSWDPDRCELEAQVYLTLARAAWRDADRLRGLRERRKAGPRGRV
jgi:hypothetical protein